MVRAAGQCQVERGEVDVVEGMGRDHVGGSIAQALLALMRQDQGSQEPCGWGQWSRIWVMHTSLALPALPWPRRGWRVIQMVLAMRHEEYCRRRRCAIT